jgi:hypothetical protein
MAVAKSGEIEHYRDTQAPSETVEKPKPKPQEKPKEKSFKADAPDPVDVKIEVGAPCIHNGCKATYRDESSKTEMCVYHPGDAEFHEGSKGKLNLSVLFAQLHFFNCGMKILE